MRTNIAVQNLSVLDDGDYDVSQVRNIAAFVLASCVMPLPEASLALFGTRNILKIPWGQCLIRIANIEECYELRLRLDHAERFGDICIQTELLSLWNDRSDLLVMAKVYDAVTLLNRDRLSAGEEPRYDLVIKGVEWSGLSLASEPVGKMLRPFVTRLTANLPTKASADLPQSV